MRATPHKRQHLRGKHQESSGEQRNQRQHIEIQAVGPRQARAAFRIGLRGCHVHTGGKLVLQFALERRDNHARLEPQIDTAKLAKAAETPLCSGDVHDANPLPIPAFRQHADHLHFDDSGADHHAQRGAHIEAEPARG